MTVNHLRSLRVLKIATISWFISVALSQLLFIIYIFRFYGGNALSNSLEVWNEMTIKGYISEDSMGNIVFASHLFFAVILLVAGLLQLVPWVRENAIKFHRYSGRVYIFTAVLLSLGGLYLIWVREAFLSLNGALAITLNAFLILGFSYATIQAARSGKIKSHRKWALRTFMVESGVWFFRVGFMAWIVINQDAKWSTENLDGPFDIVWAYANYLLPLLVLELYFYMSEKPEKWKHYIMAAILFLSVVLIGVGTFGSYLMMWGPNM